MNLLWEVPKERTCSHADIEPHWYVSQKIHVFCKRQAQSYTPVKFPTISVFCWEIFLPVPTKTMKYQTSMQFGHSWNSHDPLICHFNRCACLNWMKVDKSSYAVRAASRALIDEMNRANGKHRDLCATYTLTNITEAVMYKPNRKMLMFRKSRDKGGRVPDFSDDIEITEKLYQITLVAEPGAAAYESTVKYIVKEDRYVVDLHEVSRINKYGNQPHCIADKSPYLRAFCFCKDLLTAK